MMRIQLAVVLWCLPLVACGRGGPPIRRRKRRLR